MISRQPNKLRQFEGLVNPLDRILTSIPEPRQDKEEDVALVQNVAWLLSVLLEWQVRAGACGLMSGWLGWLLS